MFVHSFSVVFRCLLLLCASLWLSACGDLPVQGSKEDAGQLPERTPSPLLRALAAQTPAQDSPPGASAYHLIDDGLDALAARLSLLRSAQRSVDIQTYIWANDTTGRLLMRQLLRTADRGVRVRVLLDDNNTAGMDPLLRMLDAHPHITVRLFNPFPSRALRAFDWGRDFRRVNRRMHNKLMLVDQSLTLVGGRNWGDAYFRSSEDLHFEDVELLVHGPVVAQAEASFERYWQSPDAFALAGLLGSETASRDALDAQVRHSMATPAAKDWRAQLLDSPMLALRSDPVQRGWAWAPMELIDDAPLKLQQQPEDGQSALMQRLSAMFGRARHTLDLISPYFVPGQEGTQALGALVQQGVRVRVLTNSLAATDVAAVHSGYARHRKELLKGGVALYELQPDLGLGGPQQGPRRPRLVAQRSSLHSKTFIVDREDVFIGSLNLDPRSSRLNTEVGLIVRSPALAQQLQDKLDALLAQSAWQLALDDQGGLLWQAGPNAGAPSDPGVSSLSRSGADPAALRQEPQASPARRFLIWILLLLDLDWML